MRNLKLNMRKLSKFKFLPTFIALIFFISCEQSEDLSQLEPYLKKTVNWNFKTPGRVVPLNIYFNGDTASPDGSEVIVYIKNKAIERIGQESDLSILQDFLEKKFILILIDFGNDKKAVSPDFDNDLFEIYRAVFGYQQESLLKETNLKPRPYRCFFIPAGYRIAEDLVYWEIDKHGVYGTLEYIMDSYNKDIVPKTPGLKPVTSPLDMIDKNGKTFDFRVKMDILYPSEAKKKLPVFINSSTISERNPNESPRGYLPHYIGFTMKGYVLVVMGHCFNPCVNHYFHFNKFTLDHWNGLACYTAAIRYLNMNADKYFMDTKYIGGIGQSKGQYAFTRLSDPNHASGTESKKFEGFPEGTPEPQPWQGYSSRITAAYQGMGMGIFEPEYITPDYVPTLVVCGDIERDVISKDGHPKFVKRLEELNVNHFNLMMRGLAHEYPHGYDEVLGIDRYRLVHDFFDRYLKVEEKLPPVVLLVSPRDQRQDVSPDETISVHFAPVIDEKSIIEEKGIKIINLNDNRSVSGKWKVTHGGTKFSFIPNEPLINNTSYRITVTRTVRDKAGTRLDKEKHIQFKMR